MATNPFTQLKSRYAVFSVFGLSIVTAGLLYRLLTHLGWLPWERADPMATPVLLLVVFSILGLSIGWSSYWVGLRPAYLFGRPPWGFARLEILLLAASLLLFSLGSFSVTFYLVSRMDPQLVTDTLATRLLLTPNETVYPALYNGLMLFILIIYAPLVEELVFRGILLQRWSLRWGLRPALIATSLLFGILHTTNPVGLMVFGLVMALLYVRTQSLWVPIGCHALNNLAAVGIELLTQSANRDRTVDTLADLQQSWWIGLVFILISAPLLIRFVVRAWPPAGQKAPYFINAR